MKAGAVNKFSIAPDGVELSTPKSEVMWTYAAATSDDTYEAKGLVLTPDKGMLSAVQYNALKDNENLVVELYRVRSLYRRSSRRSNCRLLRPMIRMCKRSI